MKVSNSLKILTLYETTSTTLTERKKQHICLAKLETTSLRNCYQADQSLDRNQHYENDQISINDISVFVNPL